MHTSTAQCFSAEMTLYSQLKCDGNGSHSIRMLKRHLLLNSQTHTTTTRTTLRMYQCITVSHCISVAKKHPSMTAQSCTHRSVRTAATQVAPVTVPSLGKHTKKYSPAFKVYVQEQTTTLPPTIFKIVARKTLFIHPPIRLDVAGVSLYHSSRRNQQGRILPSNCGHPV